MSNIPAFIYALFIALLCGALYHFFRGGGGWKLLFYLVLSVLGFAAGQGFSLWRGWILLSFGKLDFGSGVLGSLLLLVLGEWLGKVDSNGGGESKV